MKSKFMIKSKKMFLEIAGITVLVLVLSLVLTFLTVGNKVLQEIIFGYLASLIIFSSGFLSINWSLKKSLKTFMGVVLGGMITRFIMIGVILYLFIRFTSLNVIYFISSFFVFYLIYQIFEIRYINTNLSKGRKWLKFLKQAS